MNAISLYPRRAGLRSRAEAIRIARIAAAAAAAAMCLGLAGCAGYWDWPPEGGGGYGERLPIQHERLAAQRLRLFDCEERGARSLAASDFSRAETLMLRIRRSFAAGLRDDAEFDMDRLDDILAIVERRLHGARR